MNHWTVKPNAPSRAVDSSEDYHLSQRSILRQKLSLDTDSCFQLGTNVTAVSPPKRKQMLSVEKIAKKKPLNSSSQRPKEEQIPKSKKSSKKHWLLATMQNCRNMLKGDKCTKVKSHAEKKSSCGPSMGHFINKKSPRELQKDVTTRQYCESVSKGLKRKRSVEVPVPGGEYPSAPPRPIPGSSQRIPEVPMGPPAKKFRKDDLQTPQWPGPCGRPLSSTVTSLTESFTPEVSRPFPFWRQKEIEEMKREAQRERQQAARLTENGLDCKIFIDRTDDRLCCYFRELDIIYYNYVQESIC